LPTWRRPTAEPQQQTLRSLASSTASDESERRDDRIEMIAITVPFLLMISGLAAIVAAVLLSHPVVRASWVDQPDILTKLSAT
jgi:hypothetical protein